MKHLLALLLLCHFAIAADMPKFGWKQVRSETFTLNPMGKRYFRLTNAKWRLEFQAETAIYTGVMNPQQYAEVLHLKYLPLTAFNNFACHKVSIIEAQTECNVGIPNAVLAIRDKRGPISGVFGLTEGAAGAAGVVTAPHTAAADVAAMQASDKKLKDIKSRSHSINGHVSKIAALYRSSHFAAISMRCSDLSS